MYAAFCRWLPHWCWHCQLTEVECWQEQPESSKSTPPQTIGREAQCQRITYLKFYKLGGGEKLLEFTEILETFGTFSRQIEIMIDWWEGSEEHLVKGWEIRRTRSNSWRNVAGCQRVNMVRPGKMTIKPLHVVEQRRYLELFLIQSYSIHVYYSLSRQLRSWN